MSGQERNHHGSMHHLSNSEEDWDSGLSSETSSPPQSPCLESPQRPLVQVARPQFPETPQSYGHVGEWKKFEKMFCFVAHLCKWTENEKLVRLKACLPDEAVTYMRTLPPGVGNNYQDLMQQLCQRFQGAGRPEAICRQLPNIKHRVFKTRKQFADRIRGLVSTASKDYGPAATPVMDAMAKESSLPGLRDRTWATTAANHRPLPNIRAALEAVNDEDAIQKSLGRSSSLGQHVTSLEDTVEARQSCGTGHPESGRPASQPMTVCIAVQSTENVPPDKHKPPGNSPRRKKPDHERCFGRNQQSHFCSKCPLPESPKGNGQQ